MRTIIGLWPGTGSGFAPQGYRAALAVMLALQVAGALCFLLVRSHSPKAPIAPAA